MPLSFRELTQPAVEPLTLAQAKSHLRVDFTDDDTYITSLITAARQYVEQVTNRAIFNRSMLLTLDYFPFPGWSTTYGQTYNTALSWYYRGMTIRLPKPALVSVESITYLAADGVTSIVIDPAKYIVDTTSELGRISPAPGYTWPYQQNYLPGQVRITYTAGTYGDGVEANNCPQTIIQAMLLLIGHWYEHREAASEKPQTNIPLAVDALLASETFDSFEW